MKIEVGKYYRRRDGALVYIQRKRSTKSGLYVCDRGNNYHPSYLCEGDSLDLINEVEVTDIKPPLEVKDGDHVRTDKGYEFGPVSVDDAGIWFMSCRWWMSCEPFGSAHHFGNIIEVTKRGADE